MRNGNAKLAGIIAIVYAITFFSGIFVHYFMSGGAYILQYSLSLPTTWIVLVVALTIGWGLLKHYRWAWWLGLVAVIYQLLGISTHALKLLLDKQACPS